MNGNNRHFRGDNVIIRNGVVITNTPLNFTVGDNENNHNSNQSFDSGHNNQQIISNQEAGSHNNGNGIEKNADKNVSEPNVPNQANPELNVADGTNKDESSGSSKPAHAHNQSSGSNNFVPQNSEARIHGTNIEGDNRNIGWLHTIINSPMHFTVGANSNNFNRNNGPDTGLNIFQQTNSTINVPSNDTNTSTTGNPDDHRPNETGSSNMCDVGASSSSSSSSSGSSSLISDNTSNSDINSDPSINIINMNGRSVSVDDKGNIIAYGNTIINSPINYTVGNNSNNVNSNNWTNTGVNYQQINSNNDGFPPSHENSSGNDGGAGGSNFSFWQGPQFPPNFPFHDGSPFRDGFPFHNGFPFNNVPFGPRDNNARTNLQANQQQDPSSNFNSNTNGNNNSYSGNNNYFSSADSYINSPINYNVGHYSNNTNSNNNSRIGHDMQQTTSKKNGSINCETGSKSAKPQKDGQDGTN